MIYGVTKNSSITMPPKQKDLKAECTKRGLDATGQRAADLPTSSVGNADEITPTPAPAKKVGGIQCDDHLRMIL